MLHGKAIQRTVLRLSLCFETIRQQTGKCHVVALTWQAQSQQILYASCPGIVLTVDDMHFGTASGPIR